MHCLKLLGAVEEDVRLPGVPEVCHAAHLLVVELKPALRPVLAPVGPAAGSVVALLCRAVVITHSVEDVLLSPGGDGVTCKKETKNDDMLLTIRDDNLI